MIRWFAGHPTAANLLFLLIMAAGLFAAPYLQRETFPDYRPTEVSIDIIYRGANAADVEDALCNRMYDAVKSVENLNEFTCIAQDNIATSIAKMDASGDSLRFVNDLQTEVSAITDPPKRAERPIVRQLHRSDHVTAIAVSGNLDLAQLENYASELEAKVMGIKGVASVKTQGMSQRQWQIEIPREVLAQHNLSINMLAQRIASQNIDLPLGTLETSERNVLLRFTDQRRTLAELASIIVVSDTDGGELTLGELAVLREAAELAEEKIYFNGERALVLEVGKSLNADALNVFEDIQQLLEFERKRFNGLITLSITQDMTNIVRDRLQMLVKNGVMGLLLVVAVMSLFFRPRFALWASLGLLAAFKGAFVVMVLTGLSLNMITLVALLMAIGIVMDDAIVITDSIAAHSLKQKSPLDAVVLGVQQVLPGVLSSFLTTIVVFAPLAFLAGELGAVLEVLPIVLIAALAASLVEAFWILPNHLKHSLGKSNKADTRFRQGFEQTFEKFREATGKITDLAIRFRYLVLGLTIGLMAASTGFVVGGHIGSEAMPDIDGDVLEVRILMPQGTPLHKTERVAQQVEDAVQRINMHYQPQQPKQQHLVQAIQKRFNYNPSARETGTHVATVMIDLLTSEQRTVNLDELTLSLKSEIGALSGVERLVIQEPGFGPAGIPVEIRLQSDQLTDLQRAAEDLASYLEQYKAVYNVTSNLRLGKPQLAYSLAEGAHSLGLTAENIASQMRGAFLGDIIDTQRIGSRDVEIVVKQSIFDRNSIDDVLDQTILLPTGERTPLSVVTNVTERRDWARITRINGSRVVTVEANVDARETSGQEVVNDLKRNWLDSFVQEHPSVNVHFEGQVARSAETGKSIGRGLLIGLVGIFVILSFQFRSYLEPLIVMISIPLAFIGVLWGHVIMGYYLSMPSLIGAASLAGIVVNNAILLIHFIKTHLQHGLDVVTAAGQASRDRFRAIFISSTTTIFGLLPLLAETSTQAASIKPMVIAVVFGLLSATVLVILIIPVLYVLFYEWGWAQKLTDKS